MKAKELRIGNLVNYGDGVLVLDINDFRDYDFKKFEPIPLTEEWLVKFGFEPHGERNSLNGYSKNKLRVEYLFDNLEARLIKDSETSYHLTTLKHVHQLQNLYFALTNEELEIK